MKTLPIYIVDAFAEQAFRGNPAAVCLLEREVPEAWMQSLAMEMNLSETAFVLPEGDHYTLRWFTPAAEVDLCGHATLASAHTLWETGALSNDQPAAFDTRSGRLTCTRQGDHITMDFPAIPVKPSVMNEKLNFALGCDPIYTGKAGEDILLEVQGEDVLRALTPNFAVLSRIEARGFIATSLSNGDEYDFVSRFFAPRHNIDEDPVTGSAHCALATYWNSRIGKTTFTAYQASSRGGVVHVELKGERVSLNGQAITTLAAEIQPGAMPPTL